MPSIRVAIGVASPFPSRSGGPAASKSRSSPASAKADVLSTSKAILLLVVGVFSAADAAEPDEPWLRIRFIGLDRLPGDLTPLGGDGAAGDGGFLDILLTFGDFGEPFWLIAAPDVVCIGSTSEAEVVDDNVALRAIIESQALSRGHKDG